MNQNRGKGMTRTAAEEQSLDGCWGMTAPVSSLTWIWGYRPTSDGEISQGQQTLLLEEQKLCYCHFWNGHLKVSSTTRVCDQAVMHPQTSERQETTRISAGNFMLFLTEAATGRLRKGQKQTFNLMSPTFKLSYVSAIVGCCFKEHTCEIPQFTDVHVKWPREWRTEWGDSSSCLYV